MSTPKCLLDLFTKSKCLQFKVELNLLLSDVLDFSSHRFYFILNLGFRWLHLSQLPSLAEMEALTNDLGIIDQCYQHLKNRKGQEAYLDAYKYAFSRRGKCHCILIIFHNICHFVPFLILNPFLFRGLDRSNKLLP